MLLSVKNLTFSYRNEGQTTAVLKNLSFNVERGTFVAIQGRSGSGKSTFFHLLGCLLRPTSGTILIDGVDLNSLNDDDLAYFRNRKIGFVFQQFHLLPRATVLENILLPTLYPVPHEEPTQQLRDQAVSIATRLGLGDRIYHLPNQLSGGEQQRVAIARALMSNPDILLADEPTGNLDSTNAAKILELLKALNREGKTIVLITHDDEVAQQCPIRYRMVDGEFVSRADDKAITSNPSPAVSSTIPRITPHFSKQVRAALPLALQNLRRSKARSILTMIGVTVGIASVFAMLTFGKFAEEKVMKGYEELGANTLGIYGWENWRRKATDQVSVLFESFDWEKDVLPVKHVFPEVTRIFPLAQAWGNSATYGGLVIESDVVTYGTNENMLIVTKKALSSGRNFSEHHIHNRSPVCLIGSEVNSRLFSATDAIGKILFIFDGQQVRFPCRVIGVLAPQTTSKDWRKPNLEVYLPFTYFASVEPAWQGRIQFFGAQLATGTDIERSANGIKAYFQQKYGKGGEFMVGSDTRLVGQMKKSLALFTALLTSIALITLTVGGIGINNMMLVSVTERFKEIGLRKALGATDRSIRTQFLLESTILATLAGLIGVIGGFGAYELIIYLTSKAVNKMPFEWVVEPGPLFLSVFAMLIVGILSGIVPALKAQRLQVIEALRAE